MTVSFQLPPLVVFDVESTGVNVTQDRILTCTMQFIRPGHSTQELSWTIDPGIEVPEGAAAVHGMDTAYIREHGRKDADVAIAEIYRALYAAVADYEAIVVAFNMRYDLSILHYELLRHRPTGVTPLLNHPYFAAFDPLVYDKEVDKYRKGKRTLEAMCGAYNVPFDPEDAHDARYDVIKTAEVTRAMLAKYPVDTRPFRDLMPHLAKAKEEQDSSLEAYFARSGTLNDDGSPILIDRGWPLITHMNGVKL